MTLVAKRMLVRADAQSRKKARYTTTNMVIRAAKPESKYYNATLTLGTSTAAGTLNSSRVPAGTGVQERVGRKIKIVSAEYLGNLTDNNPVRITMYVPKDQSDELILASLTAPIENDKFWVIHDKIWDANGSQTSFQYRHRFPLGLNCEFGGTTGDDINRNGVRLAVTNSGTSGTLTMHSKIWYIDN